MKTLLDIWRRRRNDPEARPTAMRGSTYARLFSGAVDFGPQLPGEPLVAHQPDEFVRIGTLVETARMLGETLMNSRWRDRPRAAGARRNRHFEQLTSSEGVEPVSNRAEAKTACPAPDREPEAGRSTR